MTIAGLTVSVNYADYLARSIDRWRDGLDELVVVTSFDDRSTADLCHAHGVPVFVSQAFYAGGATFNKAAGMCAGLRMMLRPDWTLLFDADIVPPADWRSVVEGARPQPGNLYGARRTLEDGRIVHDGELAGFFQLFHASDPNAQRDPLLDCSWRHAGGYDSEFQFRWAPANGQRDRRVRLPLTVRHLGTPGRNWCGRGNDAAQAALFAERARRGGTAHEHL